MQFPASPAATVATVAPPPVHAPADARFFHYAGARAPQRQRRTDAHGADFALYETGTPHPPPPPPPHPPPPSAGAAATPGVGAWPSTNGAPPTRRPCCWCTERSTSRAPSTYSRR